MSVKLGHHQVRRFALVAAMLLLAAQTIAVQHAHAEPADAFCSVCTSTSHDDGLPPAPQAMLVDPIDQPCVPLPDSPATRCAKTTATQARAPPTR